MLPWSRTTFFLFLTARARKLYAGGRKPRFKLPPGWHFSECRQNYYEQADVLVLRRSADHSFRSRNSPGLGPTSAVASLRATDSPGWKRFSGRLLSDFAAPPLDCSCRRGGHHHVGGPQVFQDQAGL